MSNSEKDLAVEIVYGAEASVAELMLRQAEDRLKALQTAAHALDQRITAVAGFQFAAAAFVGGLAITGPLALFAGVGAVAFVVGGIIAFRGIRSDPIHLPGIAPNWWEAARSIPSFELDVARGWAAGVMQTAITEVDDENCVRARHLNVSLRYAMAGAISMAGTALLRMFI